jgi:hypothetical protein
VAIEWFETPAGKIRSIWREVAEVPIASGAAVAELSWIKAKPIFEHDLTDDWVTVACYRQHATKNKMDGPSRLEFRMTATPNARRSAIGICIVLSVLGDPSHLSASPHTATATNDFLDSIGVISTLPDRGQPLAKTIEMIRYCGFRWVRAGIEGLSANGPTTIQTYIDLHQATGVRFSWGLLSGGNDIEKLIRTGKLLGQAGALLAFEGNNEPNNWAVTYQGGKGGGHENSWTAVAKLQRDLYQAIKSDPLLATYPVWSISESGAEKDDVGLQFLRIPVDAKTLMPGNTTYADYANVHNYIYHPNSPDPADNKVWDAADPTAAAKVDGLFGNFGVTWGKGYEGYSQKNLDGLPRVTTETGTNVSNLVTEELQGLNLMNLYLAQFTRGFKYTSVYLLRDRSDEGGNQTFGLFRPDYSRRKAAVYLHNLTTILADKGAFDKTEQLDFEIPEKPKTVHELLLQNSDHSFQLIVWDERLTGRDQVKIAFGTAHDLINIYDPTVGVGAIQSLSNVASIEVTLSDHPLIIALPPRLQ